MNARQRYNALHPSKYADLSEVAKKQKARDNLCRVHVIQRMTEENRGLR